MEGTPKTPREHFSRRRDYQLFFLKEDRIHHDAAALFYVLLSRHV